jgi:4'-phosphopantetheinyl transferase
VKLNSIAQLAVIHLVDINKITNEQITPMLRWLSASELARYQRIARNERQRQFLVGRLLLRYSLIRYLAIPPACIRLKEKIRQAPSLKITGIEPPPYFSISHSGNWVACACSDLVPLGLDIELHDARRNLDAISQHTFQPDDIEWLSKQPDKVAAFYRLWSIKEARFKLTQRYTIASIEHRYELPHAVMSMVLMTEHALDAVPDCELVTWEALVRGFE